jgi:hypothetical protein
MKLSSILRWTARIVSAAYIAFLLPFSFDTLESGLTWPFFIHNVPAMVLAILTVLAWKWPRVGSVSYSLAALFYWGFLVRLVGSARISRSIALSWFASIGLPCLCIAALFLTDHRLRSCRPD